MIVGNGLDRSGIETGTTILSKICIEYNIHKSEPEQASQFPTPSFRLSVLKSMTFPIKVRLTLLRANFNSKSRKAATTISSLSTLHSAVKSPLQIK